ncbi:MAG: LptF/LptG family permease [Paludibacteraceae bacterium]|nr:LptF/LptG family permease [Paludibacteraceae bacterium]
MLRIKKLDRYLLRNFLGLFLLTFAICCFIFLMQLLWMRINDIVGKGVEIIVLLEFLFYAVLSVVPMALPLAILLASLMSFGNLGEKFELTAMKSAGVSLFRIMRPLTVLIIFISVGAFFFSNNVLPISQVKFWSLVFSLRQKSPELDIPAGEFYKGIKGYNIYVRHKETRTGLLRDVMIYDYSQGFQNASVTVADSARVATSADHKYLQLTLYQGESFENLSQQQQRATRTQQNVPYRREIFAKKTLLIDFDTEFTRYDESVLADQHVSKNMRSLVQSIDSVSGLANTLSREQSNKLRGEYQLGRTGQEPLFMEKMPHAQPLNTDSLYEAFSLRDRQKATQYALDQAKKYKDLVQYNAVLLDDHQRYIRKHAIELHRKFTLAFACLIFFFIGAPLGAIIRKGGLGAPIVISVVLFIIYYIIDNAGFKMAREALWPVWQGMWLSSAILLPIGIFLTYKAATDSALFNPEVWMMEGEKIARKIKNTYNHLINKQQNGQD